MNKAYEPPWVPDFKTKAYEDTTYVPKEFLSMKGSLIEPPQFEACLLNEFEGFCWELKLSPIEMTVDLPAPKNKPNPYSLDDSICSEQFEQNYK